MSLKAKEILVKETKNKIENAIMKCSEQASFIANNKANEKEAFSLFYESLAKINQLVGIRNILVEFLMNEANAYPEQEKELNAIIDSIDGKLNEEEILNAQEFTKSALH